MKTQACAERRAVLRPVSAEPPLKSRKSAVLCLGIQKCVQCVEDHRALNKKILSYWPDYAKARTLRVPRVER